MMILDNASGATWEKGGGRLADHHAGMGQSGMGGLNVSVRLTINGMLCEHYPQIVETAKAASLSRMPSASDKLR